MEIKIRKSTEKEKTIIGFMLSYFGVLFLTYVFMFENSLIGRIFWGILNVTKSGLGL